MITSTQNPRVKAAVKLRVARERKKQGRIIIDGARELLRAWQAGVELVEVFVCHELCTSDDCRQLLKALVEPQARQEQRHSPTAEYRKDAADSHPQPPAPPGGKRSGGKPIARFTPGQSPGLRAASGASGGRPEVLHVTQKVFERLAFGERAEGVVGVAKAPSMSLTDLSLAPNPIVAVLEGVEKPGNVGAVLRSADAAGVSALIVTDGGTDLYNPNAIRASLGAIFTVPVCTASSAETIDWLRSRGVAIYAARVDAELDYTQADFTRPCAIVLGSETDGLTDVWRPRTAPDTGITSIKLPMLGVADSLNVSATAAVLFYEALRQRRG